MSGVTFDYMEEYLRSLIPANTGIFKELEEFAKENHVPIIQPEGAKFLELMVSLTKPKKILELGTAIGYSSILMNEATGKEAIIKTIERDEEMVTLAKKNIKRYGLEEKIEVLQGDCLEILENLDEKFDLIFMDAGKGHYNHFLPHCLRLLEEKGTLISDNVLFRGMIATDDLVKRRQMTIVKRMRSYLELISKDDSLITTVIPIGDGVAITKRR